MNEFSVLIGGKAGFGIDKASIVIADIIRHCGYRIYIYRDYPSIIRGGHTFSIIRAHPRQFIAAHRDVVDILIALNQETLDLHKGRLNQKGLVIYDPDAVKADSIPKDRQSISVPFTNILKEEAAPEIMRNTCAVGAMARAIGVSKESLAQTCKSNFTSQTDLNIKIAFRGYESAKDIITIEPTGLDNLPLFSGNELTALGLVKAGLKSYVAYPMTPSSPILHFLAQAADKFSIKVIHPESEIAVILTALGLAYCGEKVAVGTSGGGFCLMTEGLSFSAMAELPVVIILGQRPGPSTGLPTYSSQTELLFALNAGQGEFPRFVVAPGDAEEAYYWPQVAMNISWKYQISSIILSDKTLGEGAYSFDEKKAKEIKKEEASIWDKKVPYKRYADAENGVSPLAFPPQKDAVIKVNSYEHDEAGLSTEDPAMVRKMQEKRLRKEKYIKEYLRDYEMVKTYGKSDSKTALLCWGSNKGVCVEVAGELGIKAIQPVVLWPFPIEVFKKALVGVERLVLVENSATGQLTRLVNIYGIKVDEAVLKYDGRPFSVDELSERLKKVIAP